MDPCTTPVCIDCVFIVTRLGCGWRQSQHSAELEQGASKIPIGLGIFRAMVAIIKSRGDKGANIELMR